MSRTVVLIHEDFEGPARVADILTEEGHALEIRSLHRGDSIPADLGAEDLLVVMGGPMRVGDRARPEYSFLGREIEVLRQRAAADAPVLGICLGAQLLAYAAGAAVRPMTSDDGKTRLYEVGWGDVRFHRETGGDVLAGIPNEAMMLHWHGDAFELPPGARLLASSRICPNQGFQLGAHLFGLQFHCEASAEDVASFLREDAAFVVTANGADGVERVRRETDLHLRTSRAIGDRLLRNILQAMARR